MVSLKIFSLAALLVGVQSRYVEDYMYRPSAPRNILYTDDRSNILEDDFEDALAESVHPGHIRMTRQIRGSLSTNPDGSSNLNAMLPLAGNDQNVLSAIASGTGLKPGGGYHAATGGLQLQNVNGHALTLTKTHIPTFGDQLTAAGKVNLLNTERHNLNANAFITRNKPNIPNIPNFNTHGAGVDYMFNNKIGASLSASRTPLFQKTDLSAMGNLNLFRDRSSSLDFNAGATRSMSPFIPKSSWQPSFGLTFSRGF